MLQRKNLILISILAIVLVFALARTTESSNSYPQVVYKEDRTTITELCLNGIVNYLIQTSGNTGNNEFSLLIPAFKPGGLGPVDSIKCR